MRGSELQAYGLQRELQTSLKSTAITSVSKFKNKGLGIKSDGECLSTPHKAQGLSSAPQIINVFSNTHLGQKLKAHLAQSAEPLLQLHL